MSLNLKFARAYATAGMPVFPLNGKQPATRHGFKDATTNLDQVDQWWTNSSYNVGLPVPKGVVVLDWDPRSGPDALDQLQDRYGELPETTTCITGRGDGGKHIYLKSPAGRITDRNLPDGIDIRAGEKHYLVAPPSIHPDTGGHYYWAGPEFMADCPGWLEDLISVTTDITTPYDAPEGIEGEGLVRFVAGLEQGQRNHGYFWAICEAIETGIWSTVKEDIKSAARSIGLSEHEIEATAASAERRMS